MNTTIEEIINKCLVKHRKLTPYHPKANGKSKKTIDILYKTITKIVQGSNTN